VHQSEKVLTALSVAQRCHPCGGTLPSFRQKAEGVLAVLPPRLGSCRAVCPCTYAAVCWQPPHIGSAHSQQWNV